MRQHIVRFFSKPLQAIFASAVAMAFLFAAVAMTLPARVKVSMAFTIAQQARQETSDYSYDGYYALRASELVADTMISWLSTPSIVKEIYANAKIPMTDAEIDALSGRMFRGKKFSSQNVVVTYSAADALTATNLYHALALSLSNRARSLVLSPDQQTLFLVTASEPVIANAGVPPKRAGIAGAFVGAFLGLAFAYTASRKTA